MTEAAASGNTICGSPKIYRFSAGGSPVDAVMGMIFGSVLGLVTVYLLYQEGYGAVWKIVLMLVGYVAVHFLSLKSSGRRFEERREEIRSRL